MRCVQTAEQLSCGCARGCGRVVVVGGGGEWEVELLALRLGALETAAQVGYELPGMAVAPSLPSATSSAPAPAPAPAPAVRPSTAEAAAEEYSAGGAKGGSEAAATRPRVPSIGGDECSICFNALNTEPCTCGSPRAPGARCARWAGWGTSPWLGLSVPR